MGRTPKIVTELDALMVKYLRNPNASPEIGPARIIRSAMWSDERNATRTIYEALGQPSAPGQVIAFGYLVAMGKLHDVPVNGLRIVSKYAALWARHQPTVVGGRYHSLAEHFEKIRGNLQKQNASLEAAVNITDVEIPHISGQGFDGRRQRSTTAGSTYSDRADAFGR